MGIKPLGECLNGTGQSSFFNAGIDLFIVNPHRRLRDVLRHCHIHDGKLLKHRAEQFVVGIAVEFPDILTVQQHPTLRGVK